MGAWPSYTRAPDCVTPDRGVWEPQIKGHPPMSERDDLEVTVWEAFPKTFDRCES
jgi:hypothetical protein